MRRGRPGVTIAILALCGVLASLQYTLLVPIIPQFPELLGAPVADASWLLTATLLTSAIATPVLGRLADLYGKRRMLAVALVALVIGSLLCAVGTSLWVMVAGRAFQGFAGALIAVGISLLRDQVPPERAVFAVSLMSATQGLGSALGLPLSGLMVNAFGWHSLFWVTCALALLLLALLLWLIPESPIRQAGRFDLPGALLLAAALMAVLLPVTKGNVWGWGHPAVLSLFAAAAVLLAVWFPLQLRTSVPMVDLRTAARRPVLLTNCAGLFIGFGMFENMLVTTQVLQQSAATGFGLGLTVGLTGLVMLPGGLAIMAMAPVNSRLLTRRGGRFVLLVGSALMGLAYAFRIQFSGSVLEVVLGATMVSVAVSMAFAAMPSLIMASVPIGQTASAQGINALMRSIGMTTGSAIVVAVIAGTSVELGGVEVPTWTSIQVTLAMGVAASAVAFVLTWFVPAPVRAASQLPVHASRGDEVAISGVVRAVDGLPIVAPALVAVLDGDGSALDWGRTDGEGRYAAVVPGGVVFTLVATAQGWSPVARMVTDVGAVGEREYDLVLKQELTVAGRVSLDGAPVSGAVVALHTVAGDEVEAVRTDAVGRYVMRLPVAGRYLVTAFDVGTASSRSLKAQFGLGERVIDVELER